jgi:hypothetical protein
VAAGGGAGAPTGGLCHAGAARRAPRAPPTVGLIPRPRVRRRPRDARHVDSLSRVTGFDHAVLRGARHGLRWGCDEKSCDEKTAPFTGIQMCKATKAQNPRPRWEASATPHPPPAPCDPRPGAIPRSTRTPSFATEGRGRARCRPGP